MSSLHFWQLFSLVLFTAYVLACSILGKVKKPKDKPEPKKPMAEYDHGLHDGNRDRSRSKFDNWH
jgi:hypothetical protein